MKRANRFVIVAYTEKGSRLAWETTHQKKPMGLREFADALAEVAASVRTMAMTEEELAAKAADART